MNCRLLLPQVFEGGETPFDLCMVEVGVKEANRRRQNGRARGKSDEIGRATHAGQMLKHLAVAGSKPFEIVRQHSGKRPNQRAVNSQLVKQLNMLKLQAQQVDKFLLVHFMDMEGILVVLRFRIDFPVGRRNDHETVRSENPIDLSDKTTLVGEVFNGFKTDHDIH